MAEAAKLVHVRGVVQAWMEPERQGEWGIADDQRDAVLAEVGDFLRHHRLLPAASAGPPWDVDRPAATGRVEASDRARRSSVR